jgi:hypothetical protein
LHRFGVTSIGKPDAGGTTGSVVMRMDISTNSLLFPPIQDGRGLFVNPVEVQFSNVGKRFTFRALYVPGKTIIDGGEIK